MLPLGFEPRPKRLKVSCANRWHYRSVLLKYTTLRDVCQVDLNGIEPMTSWMQIRRSPSWATGPSIFCNHAPGETRTRKTVRPTDFKSVVYTDSTTGATSLDKKSSHWVREEPIYYLDCHPQPSLSLHLTLISSETSPVPLRWHLTTRVQKERGRCTPNPTPDSPATTSLHFSITQHLKYT